MPEPLRKGDCQAETSGNTNELPAPFSSSPAVLRVEPVAVAATATAASAQSTASESSRRFMGWSFLLIADSPVGSVRGSHRSHPIGARKSLVSGYNVVNAGVLPV